MVALEEVSEALTNSNTRSNSPIKSKLIEESQNDNNKKYSVIINTG